MRTNSSLVPSAFVLLLFPLVFLHAPLPWPYQIRLVLICALLFVFLRGARSGGGAIADDPLALSLLLAALVIFVLVEFGETTPDHGSDPSTAVLAWPLCIVVLAGLATIYAHSVGIRSEVRDAHQRAANRQHVVDLCVSVIAGPAVAVLIWQTAESRDQTNYLRIMKIGMVLMAYFLSSRAWRYVDSHHLRWSLWCGLLALMLSVAVGCFTAGRLFLDRAAAFEDVLNAPRNASTRLAAIAEQNRRTLRLPQFEHSRLLASIRGNDDFPPEAGLLLQGLSSLEQRDWDSAASRLDSIIQLRSGVLAIDRLWCYTTRGTALARVSEWTDVAENASDGLREYPSELALEAQLVVGLVKNQKSWLPTSIDSAATLLRTGQVFSDISARLAKLQPGQSHNLSDITSPVAIAAFHNIDTAELAELLDRLGVLLLHPATHVGATTTRVPTSIYIRSAAYGYGRGTIVVGGTDLFAPTDQPPWSYLVAVIEPRNGRILRIGSFHWSRDDVSCCGRRLLHFLDDVPEGSIVCISIGGGAITLDLHGRAALETIGVDYDSSVPNLWGSTMVGVKGALLGTAAVSYAKRTATVSLLPGNFKPNVGSLSALLQSEAQLRNRTVAYISEDTLAWADRL
jgi:hypothetical protein